MTKTGKLYRDVFEAAERFMAGWSVARKKRRARSAAQPGSITHESEKEVGGVGKPLLKKKYGDGRQRSKAQGQPPNNR